MQMLGGPFVFASFRFFIILIVRWCCWTARVLLVALRCAAVWRRAIAAPLPCRRADRRGLQRVPPLWLMRGRGGAIAMRATRLVRPAFACHAGGSQENFCD